MVGGARAATLLLRRQRSVASDAPSTAQTRGPPPPLSRGRMHASPFPRAHARECCRTTMSRTPLLPSVARMSGAICGYEREALKPIPDFTSFHPGYETLCGSLPAINKRKRNAGRRTLQCPHATARGARHGDGGLRRPSASGALACRRSTNGTCGSDRTPPLSSSSRTSWDGSTEERVLSVPCRPSTAGVMSPQAGRHAGRSFWPGAARERTANPPAGTVLAPPAGLPPPDVLSGQDGA